MNKKLYCISIASTFILSVLVGCGGEQTNETMSWEQFRELSTRQIGDETFYVVGGDEVVSLAELEQTYEHYLTLSSGLLVESSSHHATVNVVGGRRDIWSRSQAQNLTYCVSNQFGDQKRRVVRAMRRAAADWERSANVNFRYINSEDGNCTTSNNRVLFPVIPYSGGGAAAFFPSFSDSQRRVVFDLQDLSRPVYGNLTGITRHELGHVLGLRHEHIRNADPECREGGQRETLTSYDTASVMHYPWCPGGTRQGNLRLTRRDREGIRELYP